MKRNLTLILMLCFLIGLSFQTKAQSSDPCPTVYLNDDNLPDLPDALCSGDLLELCFDLAVDPTLFNAQGIDFGYEITIDGVVTPIDLTNSWSPGTAVDPIADGQICFSATVPDGANSCQPYDLSLLIISVNYNDASCPVNTVAFDLTAGGLDLDGPDLNAIIPLLGVAGLNPIDVQVYPNPNWTASIVTGPNCNGNADYEYLITSADGSACDGIIGTGIAGSSGCPSAAAEIPEITYTNFELVLDENGDPALDDYGNTIPNPCAINLVIPGLIADCLDTCCPNPVSAGFNVNSVCFGDFAEFCIVFDDLIEGTISMTIGNSIGIVNGNQVCTDVLIEAGLPTCEYGDIFQTGVDITCDGVPVDLSVITNYLPAIFNVGINPLSDCEPTGCTDPMACNFDPNAVCDDGSCLEDDCLGDCGGAAIAGTACDDGDPNTENDLYDAYCNCAGTFVPVLGCTYDTACNFNPDANTDDGSCATLDCNNDCGGTAFAGTDCDDGDPTTQGDVFDEYCNCVGDQIPGCMDQAACNFNPDATVDDGSCTANDCEGECGGAAIAGTTCDDGDDTTSNDVYNEDCICLGVANPVLGCTDPNACNFDQAATVDDGSCASNDCLGECGGEAIVGSACDDGDDTTSNDVYTEDCDCAGVANPVPGCTDANACNFNPDATEDDGSCLTNDCAGECGGSVTEGTACDDGDDTTSDDVYQADCTCQGTSDTDVMGCTDTNACNFNPDANVDDGSCTSNDCEGECGGSATEGTVCDDGNSDTENDVYQADCTCAGTPVQNDVLGCTDPDALNYNPDATIDDGSCFDYCNSAAGTIAFTFGGEYGNMSYICYGNDVVVDADDFLLVPGQSVYYVYHTDGPNATAPIQNVITLGSFLNNNVGKQTVWVTAFGATNDGSGGPNYNDPCLTQSMNLEIQLLDPITIDYAEDCDESTGDFFYTFSVNGGLPECLPGATYNVTGDYWDGLAMHGESISVGPISDAENFSILADDSNGCSGSDDFDVNCTKLPIQLISFEGEAEANGNLLKWVTASEIENDFFTIEKSTDGVQFTALTTFVGNGTTSNISNYSYLDREAVNGLTYYRLSQTDFDGTHVIVDVTAVQRGEDITGITDVYPIPAITAVNVNYQSVNDALVVVEVYDMIGRLIEAIEVPTIAGINQMSLDVSNYNDGIYFISIINGDINSTQKFIVE